MNLGEYITEEPIYSAGKRVGTLYTLWNAKGPVQRWSVMDKDASDARDEGAARQPK